MFVGSLCDIERYRGLFKSLDVLIDWLADHDPQDLELGSHQILGDKVYANVMEATTRAPEDAHFETHRRYMDLQIDLAGREAFRVTAGETSPVTPYDEKDDFELVDSDYGIDGNLADGAFALFLAGEPHMPTLVFGEDGPSPVRKVCFKLIVDELFA
ncbi:YhcH/YjgK/YiaL family protein [Collinsella sp. An307]|uniref:YhcH/YjgK/YiaL family protein n=1 Tax=Collinsella sp. An307 TaxID=1965630 RepID=UPI000B36AB9A|nr:YhcH/YjgK/YiaL family protein [Collinsella sp. An307]OUO20771.1 hypothetical protein B5F89_04350 [Collinsella sp. An307]